MVACTRSYHPYKFKHISAHGKAYKFSFFPYNPAMEQPTYVNFFLRKILNVQSLRGSRYLGEERGGIRRAREARGALHAR